MVYLWWNNEFGTWNVCIHFHSEGCSFKHSSKPTPVSHLEPMTHGPRNLMSTSYKLTLKLRILNGCCYLGTFNTSDSNNGAKLFQADSRLGAAPRSRLPGIYSFVYRLRGVPWAASGTGSHDANLTIWLLSPGFPNAPNIVKIWNVCKCLKWDGPTWPNHCQNDLFFRVLGARVPIISGAAPCSPLSRNPLGCWSSSCRSARSVKGIPCHCQSLWRCKRYSYNYRKTPDRLLEHIHTHTHIYII